MPLTPFNPLRKITHTESFQEGDVLVLFGELFQRGYANGLVEAAQEKGLKVIFSTVGRRNESNQLRALTAEELALQKQPVINIPLEAGFDLEPSSQGQTPVDLCKEAGLKDWQQFKIDHKQLEESREKGRARFTKSVQYYLQELKKHIPPGKNILFAHLMAGGVPRAKIILSVLNRVFKGRGDRSIPSKDFWESDLGHLTAMSFNEVTSETFRILVEQTADLRNQKKSEGLQVSYLAYGYHGTEIYIDNDLQWQSYTPYLQGFAKINLENYAQKFFKEGVAATVYNCPEILTNSSAIFPGVEIFLYSLYKKLLEFKNPCEELKTHFANIAKKLNANIGVENIDAIIKKYFHSSHARSFKDFKDWPHHSSKEQMDFMLQAADDLYALHKSDKELITLDLSECVIKTCGHYMLAESRKPSHPVYWIGHDLILKYYNNK